MYGVQLHSLFGYRYLCAGYNFIVSLGVVFSNTELEYTCIQYLLALHSVQYQNCKALSLSARASPLRVFGFALAIKVRCSRDTNHAQSTDSNET